jgi:hypothetical protein
MEGMEVRVVDGVEVVAGEVVGGIGLRRDGVLSGLRIIRSWHRIGPPLSNTTLQDLRNLCMGRCIRQKVLHYWENLRNVQGIEWVDNLSQDCSGMWT